MKRLLLISYLSIWSILAGAIQFPDSPFQGQTYNGDNSVKYTWDGDKWISEGFDLPTTVSNSVASYQIHVIVSNSVAAVTPSMVSNTVAAYQIPTLVSNSVVAYQIPTLVSNQVVTYNIPLSVSNQVIMYNVPTIVSNQVVAYNIPLLVTNAVTAANIPVIVSNTVALQLPPVVSNAVVAEVLQYGLTNVQSVVSNQVAAAIGEYAFTNIFAKPNAVQVGNVTNYTIVAAAGERQRFGWSATNNLTLIFSGPGAGYDAVVDMAFTNFMTRTVYWPTVGVQWANPAPTSNNARVIINWDGTNIWLINRTFGEIQ